MRVSEAGKAVGKPCYFYDKAECFLQRTLHAIVVGGAADARLLLNPFAVGASEFHTSALVASFGARVVDAFAEETAGTAFVLNDYTGDRSPTTQADRPRRKHLEQKYGLDLVFPARWKAVTIGSRVSVLDEG